MSFNLPMIGTVEKKTIKIYFPAAKKQPDKLTSAFTTKSKLRVKGLYNYTRICFQSIPKLLLVILLIKI